MGQRRRNSRSGERGDKEDGERGSMKRNMERSGSPPRKRNSPYTSPRGSPRVRSPSGMSAGTTRIGSPRGGSPMETERAKMVMSPPRTPNVPKARTPR